MEENYLKTQDARDYFESKGLTYKDIAEEKLELLQRYIKLELADYYLNGNDHARQMDMRLRKPLKKDIKITVKNGLEYAYLKVDGSYFEKREAISFNRDGFIGFGGEFSSVNTQPYIKAFIKWCDEIVKKKVI